MFTNILNIIQEMLDSLDIAVQMLMVDTILKTQASIIMVELIQIIHHSTVKLILLRRGQAQFNLTKMTLLEEESQVTSQSSLEEVLTKQEIRLDLDFRIRATEDQEMPVETMEHRLMDLNQSHIQGQEEIQ